MIYMRNQASYVLAAANYACTQLHHQVALSNVHYVILGKVGSSITTFLITGMQRTA